MVWEKKQEIVMQKFMVHKTPAKQSKWLTMLLVLQNSLCCAMQ